jgi:hypothetical protein
MPVSRALQQKDYTNPPLTDPSQLVLFEFAPDSIGFLYDFAAGGQNPLRL